MSQNTITVKYINADGGGFPDFVQVHPNTTVGDFFAQKKPGDVASDFHIIVKRNGTRLDLAAGELLQDGDVVSVLHVKREGA